MEKLLTKDSKNWLQKLKDESWEAELIISTVVIFGTLQLFKVIDWGINLIINTLPPSQYIIGYGIIFGGLLSISILTTMFIIHFLLRAYWVGLVGLNSVFPDYSIEDSAYSEIYTKKILGILPKLEQTIKDVDQLSSVIFSAAFFMLLIYLYMSLTASLYLLLFNYLSTYINHYILYIPIVVVISIYILLSVASIIGNLKAYKKNEKIQLWYFKIAKLGSILMLGPLYKYILQISMTFGSNFKKKKSLTGLTIVFILVGFIITIFQFSSSRMIYLVNQESYFDNTKTYSGYYASSVNTPEFLIAPQINSDIIDAKITRLFIPIYNYELNMIKDLCGEFEENEKNTEKENRKEKKEWYLKCYTEYNQVFLNEERISTEYIKYQLPETNQFGIITYIDLENERKGKNSLKIIKNLNKSTIEWEIPFQYINN